MPLITMPTILTVILVAVFLCVTLLVVAGREVVTTTVKVVAGVLARRVRAIRRRTPFKTATTEEATSG